MANGLKDIWGGLAGGVLGGVGGVLGGLSKNRHTNKLIKGTKGLMANIDTWADQNGNEDGTQSIAAQMAINENRRRLSRAARAAEGRKAVTGIDMAPEVKEMGAAQTGSLLANVAAAQQARNNEVKDQAHNQKLQLQQQINELEAGKYNAMDIINGGIGGIRKGVEDGMGLQGLFKS